MSKPVTHSSLMYTNRHGVNFATTLCRRMSNAGEDLNVADEDEAVTCKLCLKRLQIKSRMLAA